MDNFLRFVGAVACAIAGAGIVFFCIAWAVDFVEKIKNYKEGERHLERANEAEATIKRMVEEHASLVKELKDKISILEGRTAYRDSIPGTRPS